jgi:hypothetical protein
MRLTEENLNEGVDRGQVCRLWRGISSSTHPTPHCNPEMKIANVDPLHISKPLTDGSCETTE